MLDRYGRKIDYLRVSVTDRCNLRCRYCMPEGIGLVPMKDILTYEEILDVVRAAAGLGITKLKVTGGEPLVRPGCPDLIRRMKQIPGIEQVTMTTNGVLLKQYLPELMEAGLDAVNISIDSLRKDRYAQITGRDELDIVMESLDAVLSAGIRTKVNAVLQQGVNEDEWEDLAALAKGRLLDVRFIEMMPIGFGKGVPGVSNTALKEEFIKRFPELKDDTGVHGNGPAVYVQIPGWQGSIGFISALHGKFCANCNRIRLTSMGKLKACLCYEENVDLLPVLRSANAEDRRYLIEEKLREAILKKPGEHCFEEPACVTETSFMASIGG